MDAHAPAADENVVTSWYSREQTKLGLVNDVATGGSLVCVLLWVTPSKESSADRIFSSDMFSLVIFVRFLFVSLSLTFVQFHNM